jgi:phospholipid/cholesterol/gamma-HCH transport system substrate-binding protein
MITRTTKIQLLIFAIVTVIGATIVGGRYAEVDRLVIDRTYPVNVELAEAGGIFAGAEVTYRGIPIGKVGSMTYTANGVRARLDIEKSAPRMSQDTVAVVANKSAIGEQFMDLQPRSNSGPYLQAGSTIATSNTVVPLDATRLLIDVGDLVDSVDVKSLQTLINEVGVAFAGYGQDLSVIIDTMSSFVRAADQSFPETKSLINDSTDVLQTLVDKDDEFATLTKNLSKLTGTLVDKDKDIRKLLNKGPDAEKELADVVEENSSDLTSTFHSLANVTATLDHRWKSIETLSILFPLIVDGAFAYVEDSPDLKRSGMSDGRIGLIILQPGQTQAQVCKFEFGGSDAAGYRELRDPDELNALPVKHYDCLNDGKVAFNPRKTKYNFNRSAPENGKETGTWLLVGTTSN